jgi:hypothetical protein
VHAGGDGRLMAEVPRQLDQLDARVLVMKLADDFRRAIAAAVVDEHHLPRLARLIERHDDPPTELRQILLLVEDRDDDGDHGAECNGEAGRDEGKD